jgi:CheY-like chemotaxis protein
MIEDFGGRASVSARGIGLKTWRGRKFAAVLMEPDNGPVNGHGELAAHGIKARQTIILTSPTDRTRLMRLAEDGFDAFLARPVRRDTLLRILSASKARKPAAKRKRAAAAPASNKGGRKLNVLVAEDNEINALLVHVALSKAGYAVDIVGNGQAAVERACADEPRYDIVLMDLHMPVMDGPDAIRHIRRHEEQKGLASVPIFALTADSQSETREAVLAHGANGFLTKPVDPTDLARIVATAKAA